MPINQTSMAELAPPDADSFDRHVMSSILAISKHESTSGALSWNACAGLDPADFAVVLGTYFQGSCRMPDAGELHPLIRAAEETCVLDLLWSCATEHTPVQKYLAGMLARRAQRPNHLWQDLGLRDRSELSRLMNRHFKALAARNSGDMKWKKFLYRLICCDGSHAICTAPSCGECCDFQHCFGAETGECLISRHSAISRI